MKRLLTFAALGAASVLLTTCKLDELVNPQPPGTLVVSPGSVADSAAVGSRRPRAAAIVLGSTSAAQLAWRVSRAGNAAWLALPGMEGTTPDSVDLRLDPAGLLPGTYRDTVVVTPTAGGADPTRVPVRFEIHPCRDTPVTLGGTVTDSLTGADCEAPHRSGRQAKLFRFAGAAGDSVTVTLRSTTFQPYVLLDTAATPDAPPIAQSGSCADGGPGACLRYVLLRRVGDFFVEVSGDQPSDTGAFTLEVVPPRAPDAPSALAQLLPDSVTPIPIGGGTATSAFVVRAELGDLDPSDTLRLEVEVRTVGTAFTGTATAVGAIRAGSGVAAVSVGGLSDNTGYHWQARTMDQTGRASAWVAFGSNAETAPDLQVTVPQAPGLPEALDQRAADGVTSIPTGGVTGATTVVFRGTVRDLDPGDRIRLEIEVRPLTTAFTNTANGSSVPVATDNTAVVTVTQPDLADDTPYHWQARAVDLGGLASPWVQFGGNQEVDPDFAIAVPEPPTAPTGLAQLAADGVTPLSLGDSARAATVVLTGTVSDPDPGASLRLQVEVRPVGTDFTDVPTHVGDPVASAATASVTVGPLPDDVNYHWQARATDGAGLTGPWTAFGGNAETATDFRVHLPATQLAFLSQPSDAAIDVPITPPVTVEARKASGSRDSAYVGAVSVALAPGTGTAGAILAGTLSRTADGGVASFDDLSVDSVGSGYQLNATAGGLTSAASSLFDITAGSANQLVFAQEPTTVAAGGAISPAITVEVRDASNNVVTDYSTPIGLALGANPGGATLTGGAAVVPVNGVATFAGVSLDKAGTGYTLVASSAGLTRTSAAFDVTPGPAAKVAFLQGPTDVQAGALIAPAVTVAIQDQFGNTVTTSSAPVDVALSANPTDATLGGTTTGVAASAGVASFADLSLTAAASGYTLVATSAGLTTSTPSASFTVTPGPADSLVFQVQPSDAVAGQPIVPAIQVLVQDAFANPVTDAVTAVTMSILNNPAGGTLAGTASRNTAAGVSTFDDLEIDLAGTGYTLQAAGAGLVTASEAFDVVAGSGNKLAFIVQPSAAVTGEVIDPPIQVEIQDAQGNRVTTATDSVFLNIANNPPGNAALQGTRRLLAVDGVATFDDVSVNRAGTGFTVSATGPGLLSTTSAAFDITPAATVTTITGNTPNPSVTGQGVVVSYTVTVVAPGSGTPTGTVEVTDGTTVCQGAVLSGSCTLMPTTAGVDKTLTAAYQGNADFTGSTSPGVLQTVDPAATTLEITSDLPDPSVTGEPVSVNWQLTVNSPGAGTPTGTVTVTSGADQCSAAPAAGTCPLTLTSAGAKTITATYDGDLEFTGDSDTEPHTVSQAATTATIVDLAPEPSDVGAPVTVTYTVAAVAPGSGTPTGNVTVTTDEAGVECTGTVAQGSCQLTFAAAGTKTLTASYAGDANFLADVSASVTHTVDAAPTTTTITDDTPDPSVVGQPVTVTFTVTSTAGTPTGDVTVSDGTDSCTGTVAVGSCVITLTTVGARSLTATYAGDGDFAPSTSAAATHTVDPASTTTTVTGHTPDPSVVGQAVTVSFSVSAVAPGAGTPTGTVTVSGGTQSCLGTLTAGAGSCTITFTTAGTKTVTATYADADDPNFAGSVSASVTHTVNQAATTTTISNAAPPSASIGQQVTVNYSVTATAPGAGTPTGMVTVTDGIDSCQGTRTDGNCKVTFTTGGAKTLTATYGGDANFAGSTSAGFAYTVSFFTTTTTITGDTPDPSVVGQPVTVSFTVTSGSGTPTGSVTVTVSGSTDTCTGTLGSGAGSCSIAFTSTGSKSLTATYSGDPQFGTSASGAATHTVNATTTTTTIGSTTPNPSTPGQAVTVTFTVVPVAPGAGTPTGNVTVSDGAGTECTATVAVGTCDLTFANAGAKTLTATYAGDGNFLGSTSAGFAHTVDAFTTTTTITGDTPDPSLVGEAVTVTFTVTSTGGTPTGNVTVSDGTGTECTATVAVGTCALTFTAAGAPTLTATYAGDGDFAGSTSLGESHTVNAAATTTTITGDTPDPSLVGEAVTVTFTVVPVAPGAGTPTGNVTVGDGAGTECTATVAVGTCALTFTAAGAPTLTATYAGDGDFAGSTSLGESHTVDAFGAADTIRATSSLTPADTVGGTATPDPTVIVVDRLGNPVPGASVDFTPASGSGSVSASPVATDGAGLATVSWTLGTDAGPQTLDASSGTLVGSPVTFTASASPGNPAAYDVTVDDVAPLAGTDVTVTAQLTDANGNPVALADAVVTWSATGGGTFASPTSTTDASGVATVTFTTDGTAGTEHVVTATDDGAPARTGDSPTITTQ